LPPACFQDRPNLHFDIPDRDLPIYTIIVPLYREAPVVAKLVRALRQLRYPREKLDIKFMIETDDAETLAEIAKLRLGAPFEIIAPPRIGPQTKPRALAAALPFARGSLVTVYDAEDEPEPDQLRDAVAAFASGPPQLACVQAKLSIDNPDDGWFSRQFTAEYAGQFDVFLPALAKMKLPIPLGGTSNHFRTAALRHAGGWDPYNVTEDADLGMRLARYGYSIGVIDSTTWEEAPVGFTQWLRQRTRWFKGWAQTWIVHMRHPLRLLRELGLRNFLAFQLLVGGTMMSAVVHPFFMSLVLFHAATGELFMPGETAEHSARKVLALCVLGVGYFGAIALGLAGLKRRGMLRIAWVVFTIPLYWLFMSFAAWRALWQLVRAPYHWEKTPHGLARSSVRRQAANAEITPNAGLPAALPSECGPESRGHQDSPPIASPSIKVRTCPRANRSAGARGLTDRR
jgi:glycosyltransferase XagB